MKCRSCSFFFSVTIAAFTPFSSGHADETERDLGSHEHGVATLDLVIDGSSVFMDLESPWANLVGFEHEPSDSEQMAAVESALEYVEAADEAFLFTEAAGCSLHSVEIDSGFDSITHSDDHHAEGSEDHHDEDSDDHHAESEADDHHDESGETHSEILASWEFECETIEALQSIDVRLFERFEGFEELDVQLAGPSGQSATELMPTSTTIALESIR